MADVFIDNNVIYRLSSANRLGLLTKDLNVTTSKNTVLSLSQNLGGTAATRQVIGMTTMPALDGKMSGVVDPGAGWFFRSPSANAVKGSYTLHNSRTGSAMCLERMDRSAGALQITPLTKGSAKPSQIWWIRAATTKTPDGNLFVLGETGEDDPNPPPPQSYSNLDVGVGTDKASCALVTQMNKAKPPVERTTWKLEAVWFTSDDDEKGRGWF